MAILADYEIAHQEYKAFRKRWGNKNIFEYGEKMLEIEDYNKKGLCLYKEEFPDKMKL